MSNVYINKVTIRSILEKQRIEKLEKLLQEYIGNIYKFTFKGNKISLYINKNKVLEVFKDSIEDKYYFKINIDSRKDYSYSNKILDILKIIIEELINILKER
ncbi:hypothetical protein [Brachyspira sp.]|uniref:hypothetical protein n=1 Tax=Brachyspira sp. TaxID=1977261 RepID=UPI00261F46FF|nr:hypothetical protein [Brachyspira sp.]